MFSRNRRRLHAVIQALEPRQLFAVFTFTGADDSRFAWARNWSPSGIPTTGDSIIIPSGKTVDITTTNQAVGSVLPTSAGTINITGVAFTVSGDFTNTGTTTLTNASLSAGGLIVATNFSLNNSTLTVSADSLFSTLNISAGTIVGTGAVIVSSALNWSGGRIGGSGGLFLQSNSVSTFTSNGTLYPRLERLLDNDGVLNATNTANSGITLQLANNGSIANRVGSTFTISSGSISRASNTLTHTITSTGNIITGTSGNVTFDGVSLYNDETLSHTGNTLTLTGGGLFTRSTVLSNNAIINFGSGVDFTSGTISGSGSVVFSAGASTISGTAAISAPVTVSGGTVSVNNNLSLASLTLSGGTIAGTGTLTVSTTFDWNTGAMTGSGTLATSSNTLSSLATAGAKSLGRTFANNGIAFYDGSNLTFGVGGSPGTLQNNASGTFTVLADSDFIANDTQTHTITNAGTFALIPPSNAASAITINFDGVDYYNTGFLLISPGIALSTTGDFTLATTSEISMSISGRNATQLSQVFVSSPFTLAGSLQVSFTSGFQPLPTDFNLLFSAPFISSTFASTTVGDNKVLRVVYSNTSTSLAVVPPSTPTLSAGSDSGASNADRYTNVSAPFITGTAPVGAVVDIYADNVLVGTGTATSTGTYSVQISTLADGTRTLTAGIGSTRSASSQAITIDTGAPSLTVPSDISITTPLSAGTTATYTGSVTDTLDTNPALTYSVSSGSLFAPGNTVVTVTGTDLAGNTSTGTFNVNISVVVPESTLGGLDRTFGGGAGVITTVVQNVKFTSLDSFMFIASGKLLTVALDSTAGTLTFIQFNTDGSIDTTYGSSGFVTASIPSDFTGQRIQFDVSGAVYLLGILTATSQPAALRFSPSGTQDSSFGNSGVLTLTPFASGDTASSILPLAKGMFLVGGQIIRSGVTSAALFRITATGTQDLKFGTKGSFTRPGGSLDSINAIAIGPKNTLFVTGTTGDSNSASVLTLKLSAAGKLDKKFSPPPAPTGYPLSSGQKVMIQADGKVVVAAAVANSSADALANRFGTAVVRYTATGALDSTFNGNGVTVTQPPSSAPNLTSSISGFVTSDTTSLQKEFDNAVASVVQIEGGKVRQIGASSDTTSSTVTQTQLVADAIDLGVTGITLKATKPFKPKAKLSATVRLSNSGTLITPKTAPISLFLSADPTLDNADTALPAVTGKLAIMPATSKTLKLSFVAPTDAGTYFLIVVVNSGAGSFADLKTSNDTIATPNTFTVAAVPVKSEIESLLPEVEIDNFFSEEPVLF